MFASYFACLFVCLLVCLLALLMNLLSLFLYFVVCLFVYIFRLVSHEIVCDSRNLLYKYKRICAVINSWLYAILPLYEELVIFSP